MKVTGFLMTLQHADKTRGQVTEGTQARSAEVFIPIKARRLQPAFWGWPDKFAADPKAKAKRDRPLKIRLSKTVEDATMMFWPEKDELRLRSESIRSAIVSEDDLLLLLLSGDPAIDYEVAVITKDDPNYARLYGCCLMKVESKKSKKLFGYVDDDFNPLNPPREFWLMVIHKPEGQRYSLFTGKEKNRAHDEIRSLERSQYPAELLHLVEQFD